MNKHTRLVVSVLFVVIIIFAIGLTRSYVDISKDSGDSRETIEIIRKLDIDDSGNRIFEGSGSLYGVVDSGDKVIVAPEWIELSFAENGLCIASKRIGGRLLTGCIDYEGNIAVPFIYRNINRHESDGFVFYTAEADSDGSCVIYDESFSPCFMSSWDSCSVTGEDLLLKRGSSSFTYSYGENGFICKRADISGQALGKPFELNIYSRVLLSKLDCTMLEKISESVSAYLEFAFTGEQSALEMLAGSGSRNSFAMIFPGNDKVISRRLVGITDIFIFTEKSDTNDQSYAVSVIADTEIVYNDDDNGTRRLRGEYKAVVRFAASAVGITAVSGDFISHEPDYPTKEEEISAGQSGDAAVPIPDDSLTQNLPAQPMTKCRLKSLISACRLP